MRCQVVIGGQKTLPLHTIQIEVIPLLVSFILIRIIFINIIKRIFILFYFLVVFSLLGRNSEPIKGRPQFIGHGLGANIFRPSDVSYAASTQISRHP
jgi:hypothetical protein